MRAYYFPVQHSILSENALAEWASSCYSLKEPVRCRFLRGSMSDVYRVDSLDAAHILKIYLHKRHSMHAIEAEVDFLNDLCDQDIPVAAPVANNDAVYLNEINAPEGIRYAVLFDAIEGTEPQEVNLEHSRSFGRLAGRIHSYSDNSAKKYDRWHLNEKYLVEEPLTHIRQYLENRKMDWEYLSAKTDSMVKLMVRIECIVQFFLHLAFLIINYSYEARIIPVFNYFTYGIFLDFDEFRNKYHRIGRDCLYQNCNLTSRAADKWDSQ
jgi:Ser/Thr protein kinase RdoA (MazF antagonist)